jgi:hypothetical protein
MKALLDMLGKRGVTRDNTVALLREQAAHFREQYPADAACTIAAGLEAAADRVAQIKGAWIISAAPIDMVLHCPCCGVQHVDAPEPASGWANPPHRSHQCHHCRHVWRPADVATNGVITIATRGGGDSALVAPPAVVLDEASLPWVADHTVIRDAGRHAVALVIAGDLTDDELAMRAELAAAIACVMNRAGGQRMSGAIPVGGPGHPGCLHCTIAPLINKRAGEVPIEQVVGELVQSIADLIASLNSPAERARLVGKIPPLLVREVAAAVASFDRSGVRAR